MVSKVPKKPARPQTVTVQERRFRRLNSELGLEFDLFGLEHPEWMERNVPNDAIVVLQTDDPTFNQWARRIAELNSRHERPAPPIILVHIRKLRPRKSRIVRAEVEVLSDANSS